MRNNVSDDCLNFGEDDVTFHHKPITIPSWVWFYCAAATAGYYALDNIDGIHARANNTCSSLGELLDHAQ